jgi:hypothetical protein
MAETRDFGRLFFHRLSYPSSSFPLVEVGDTQEVSWPYRRAKSLVLRLPFGKQAVACGIWGAPEDEEEALLRAVSLGEKRSNVQEEEAFTKYQSGEKTGEVSEHPGVETMGRRYSF